MIDLFFEDFEPGAVRTYGRQVVDRDDMVAFAREFDPQPFHTDEASARASAVGELIGSGWYTCGLLMRALCDEWLLRAASFGGPGITEAKWLRPVRAGDVLSVRQTVLDARGSGSKPTMGFVTFQLELLNGSGQPVLHQIHTGMFGRRAAATEAPPSFGSPGKREPAEPAQTAPPAGSGHGADALAYEDVEIGAVTELGSYAFTPENVVGFASRFDTQPFHLSEEAARKSPFGRLAASGWHTASAWMRQLVLVRQAAARRAEQEGREPPRWGVSPGFRNLKWLRPVYAGDTIRYDTEVVEKRLTASRPGWGLVFSRNSGWNAAGERVFEFTGSGFWGVRSGT